MVEKLVQGDGLVEHNDTAVRQRLYLEYRKELRDRESSNSESFDRSILSLSSAGLALSIGFIKDIVPLKTATHICLLHMSWVAFAAAIVATMSSLVSSQLAIERQLVWAHEYYMERKNEVHSKRNPFDRLTIWLNRLSGVIFVLGIGLTILFAIVNTSGGAEMAKNTVVIVEKGQTVGTMTRVPGNGEQHGQTVGTMPQVSSSGGNHQSSSGSSGNNGSSSSGGDSGKK